MKNVVKGISVLLMFFCFFSCEKEEIEDQYIRTVLVYLGRDNNLADLSEEKIESLMKGWNGRGGNLIVYQDISGKNPQLLELVYKQGATTAEVIRQYNKENSADKDVFSRVIQETVQLYPADSYGLILFSHASGWLPKATLNAPRSIIIDGKDEMELTDFANAIPDNMFDFIIFEACFMAGIEVAYELKDKTTYLLGSSAEILSPGFIDTYAGSLSYLFKKEADLVSFAQKAFDYYDFQTIPYRRSATLSLIKTAQLKELATYVAKMSSLDQDSVKLDQLQFFDRYYPNHLFYDFEDYYSQLYASSPLQLEELRQLINLSVVKKWSTPEFLLAYRGFTIEKHSGLTLYIPQERYPYLNEKYKQLAWYKDTHLNSIK